MFCDKKTEDTGEQSLNNLDSALHELGMLSTVTNASNQYFHEMRRKSFGSKPNAYIRRAIPMNVDKSIILHQNSRYVSNVTIGLRMKRATNNRTSPYLLPDRIRTRSENSDGVVTDSKPTLDATQDIWMEHSSNYVSVLDPKIGYSLSRAVSPPPLKKSRSLENIKVQNIDASQPSHEMEFVSSRIQKLKVME